MNEPSHAVWEWLTDSKLFSLLVPAILGIQTYLAARREKKAAERHKIVDTKQKEIHDMVDGSLGAEKQLKEELKQELTTIRSVLTAAGLTTPSVANPTLAPGPQSGTVQHVANPTLGKTKIEDGGAEAIGKMTADTNIRVQRMANEQGRLADERVDQIETIDETMKDTNVRIKKMDDDEVEEPK